MRLLPAANVIAIGVFCLILQGGVARAQEMTVTAPPPTNNEALQAEEMIQALRALQASQVTPATQLAIDAGAAGLGGIVAPEEEKEKVMTQDELDALLQDPDSAQSKAHALAKKAKRDTAIFEETPDIEDENILAGVPVPPAMESLQKIHKARGIEDTGDDVISSKMALDMRRDAQKEAALSYGARGGLASASYQIMERMNDYNKVLDKVFNFRALLIKAPSGLLIEPPIVRESLDTLTIADDGTEAAVADQILQINRQAKIVTAPRNWRQYLVMAYMQDIPPPPRVLWPRNAREQSEWDGWIRQGWEAGHTQAGQIFDTNINQMIADYNGMIRYRMLLAQGKISQPYALHEDRGITGGKNEMRVGDRALKITGPSQFLTGADLWKPADR